MKRISEVGNLLKKIHRIYSRDLINMLQSRGYLDLRASFLDILLYISENDGPSIRSIGEACGLKKQTMTSHINELESRGYLKRVAGTEDKRELHIYLTDYGERFKLALWDAISELESTYLEDFGSVELDRIIHGLDSFFKVIKKQPEQNPGQQSILI